MRVRTVAERLTPTQRKAIGGALAQGDRLAIPARKEYLVLGLIFAFGGRLLGTGTWVLFEDEAGNGVQAPLALFEITDPRPSRHWVVQLVSDSEVALWPAAFGRAHFFEDVADGGPEQRSEFAATIRALRDESAHALVSNPARGA
jgi:hypothetical protein